MKLIMECDLRGCQFTSAGAQCQKLCHYFQGSFALSINDNDKINRSRFHGNQWMHSYQTTTMMTSVTCDCHRRPAWVKNLFKMTRLAEK